MIAFTPYNGENARVMQFAKSLFKAGIISFTAGADPTRIRFLLPAGAITEEQIDAVTDLIENTLIQEQGK
jgi:4-aminobutyrate aminotransferase-like enzyme